MKKVLALVLALATVMSMGVVAFAADILVSDGEATAEGYANVYRKDNTKPVPNATTDNSVESLPDKTLYFEIPDVTLSDGSKTDPITAAQLADEDLFKFKYKKTENGKYIKSIKLIEKDVDGTAGRENVVEVKLVDDMTDNEYKISFEVSFASKTDWDDTANFDDVTVYMPEFTIWMGNDKDETDDETYAAGEGGKYVKPVKNEENTIAWEDENDTLATLTADMDSDTKYYFPKLSTKWDNVKYAELFNDQDAFVRQWVGTPEISSTSRATLELNVPYVDEDDELTVDEESIIVYEETADGELIDITDKGTFTTNDDDEYVFTMKTRRLGTYIFAEAPVADADADDEVPADDVVDADKVNPGTGF
ncbi:hypothetical protein [Anaerotruncus rubiinfantis]|uniref:hypothetical protein n=1 Tax=Anaerotruncus rubiinfantis TaxID=1720200 RepID=UPI001898ACF8|nr:hypothetical protein [Anaerotruncus rubiinfantis]